ncbi:hypothetical protein AZC_3725 [Azorhizobium caulinodans ORS 571]|uniref:Regulator of SigK n=3 Tax=Azorhizobium caulinodans TaxID=7 RepID=A8INA4_AZOC5|nr:anti-sigma factor [Azorhizobium caulinodans]BAF89723.1 hypothetical protein AZC_3725 [Azorhizobium caulinodans ORS 571]
MSPQDRAALAGEYVLGLVDGEEAARCARLAETDPAFAAEVAGWRRRLGSLDATADAVPPSPALWERISASVADTATSQAPGEPEARTADAGSDRVAPFRHGRAWDNLPLWRGIGVTAAAAALALAIGLGAALREAARTPVLVAVLLSDQNRPAAVVNTFRDGRSELVPLEAIRAPEGKALQVWTLWDRTRGPISVGLTDAMRALDLKLDGLPIPVADQLFEVTLEPAGGSPTGRPTGPILMKGNASRTL